MISLTDNLIVDVKIWNMIHETIRSLKAELAKAKPVLDAANKFDDGRPFGGAAMMAAQIDLVKAVHKWRKE